MAQERFRQVLAAAAADPEYQTLQARCAELDRRVLDALEKLSDEARAGKLIASCLEPLVGRIPGLVHMEIRQAFSGMDYALYSEFESREALEAYAVHPLHQEAKTHFFHLLDSRVAADYEF